MEKNNLLQRIAVNPNVMAGQAAIKGTRLTVTFILELLIYGMSIEEVLTDYPQLTREDISACLLFAQQVMSNITFVPMFKQQ